MNNKWTHVSATCVRAMPSEILSTALSTPCFKRSRTHPYTSRIYESVWQHLPGHAKFSLVLCIMSLWQGRKCTIWFCSFAKSWLPSFLARSAAYNQQKLWPCSSYHSTKESIGIFSPLKEILAQTFSGISGLWAFALSQAWHSFVCSKPNNGNGYRLPCVRRCQKSVAWKLGWEEHITPPTTNPTSLHVIILAS